MCFLEYEDLYLNYVVFPTLSGFDIYEKFNHCHEPFDFIILSGRDRGNAEAPKDVVADVRLTLATPTGALQNNYHKQSQNQHAKLCGALRTRYKFKRKIRNRRFRHTSSSSVFLTRRSRSLSSIAVDESQKKHLFYSESDKSNDIAEALNYSHDNKEFMTIDGTQRLSTPIETELEDKNSESAAANWFDSLKPTPKVWSFESDNETLLRSLRLNMATAAAGDRACDLDALVVTYDDCPISTEHKACTTETHREAGEEAAAAPPDLPHDPLYEHAIEFARTHGFGFVKFVEEEDEIMDRERAKKLRKRRETARRSFLRRAANTNAFGRHETNRHPVHVRVPAYASSLKFGTATCRGLCGGRPRDAERFWRMSKTGANLEPKIKDMADARQTSKTIREALTAEMWLDVSPKCREHIRQCFHREKQTAINKERSASSPTGKAKRRSSLHSESRSAQKPLKASSLSPRRIRPGMTPFSENSLPGIQTASFPDPETAVRRSLSASDRECLRKPNFHRAGLSSPKQYPSPAKVASQEKLAAHCKGNRCGREESTQRPRASRKDTEVRTRKDAWRSGVMKLENPASQYRELIREMCDMIDSGFLQVWPSDNGTCGDESPPRPHVVTQEDAKMQQDFCRKERRGVKPQKNLANLEQVFKDTIRVCDDGENCKLNKSSCQKQGDCGNEMDTIISESDDDELWLPGVKNKRAGKQYRLCNSLSATIFRECHLHSLSSCNLLGHPNSRLSTAPLEIVQVEEDLSNSPPLEEAASENIYRCEKVHQEPKYFKRKMGNSPVTKCVTFIDNSKELFARETSSCLDLSQSDDDMTGASVSWAELSCEDVEHALSLPSASRCVRNRRTKNVFPPQAPHVSMSRSGHLVTRSGSRAGSCPNLTTHTSKMHRSMSSTCTISLRRSVSPKPRQTLPSKDTHGSVLSRAYSASPRATLCSAVGDHRRFHLEKIDGVGLRTSQASPDLKIKHENVCFSQRKEIFNEGMGSAPLAASQTRRSPDFERPKSPRRRCASPVKHISSVEFDFIEQNNVCLFPAICQAKMSTNNNKTNYVRETECESGNKQDERFVSCSENTSKPLDSNNNAGRGNNNFEETVDDVSPISSFTSQQTLQRFPKFQHQSCISKLLTPSDTSGFNNNALPARDKPLSGALPNVSVANERRKWGPVIESPNYQEECPQGQFENPHERPSSPTNNEPLKLPSLPNSRRQQNTSQAGTETEYSSKPQDEPRIRPRNHYSRHESVPVGFGAVPPAGREDDDGNFGTWQAPPQYGAARPLTLPPAVCTRPQTHTQEQRSSLRKENGRQRKGRAQTVNSPKHGRPRNRPLNRSYVISRDMDQNKEVCGDHAFYLPAPTPQRYHTERVSNSSTIESENVNTKQNSMRPPARKLELPAFINPAGDKRMPFQLMPNPSLKSPEFSASHENEIVESHTCNSFTISSVSSSEKKTVNSNNNSLPNDCETFWPTKCTFDNLCEQEVAFASTKSHQCQFPRRKTDAYFFRCFALQLLPSTEFELGSNSDRSNMCEDDTFENISNNALQPSRHNSQTDQSMRLLNSGSASSQRLHDLEREMLSLVEGQNSEGSADEITHSPCIHDHTSSQRQEDNERSSLLSQSAPNAVVRDMWDNINNASSMNFSRGREREHFRRRRLHRESPLAADLSPLAHENASAMSEYNNGELEGESHMDQSQTEGQAISWARSYGHNVNPNTPFSLPSRAASSPLWRHMLSQDPETRKLWSCEDQQRRQFQAQQNRQCDASLAYQARLRNGVPYCPTTENYWQMALDPNASTPSLGFLHPTSTTNSDQQPICSLGQTHRFSTHGMGHTQPGTEEMDMLPGDREINSPPLNSISLGGSSDQANESFGSLSSFADLYRQLGSLWARSQNQVSQRLEAMSNSMNEQLKQLKGFVERRCLNQHYDRAASNSDDIDADFDAEEDRSPLTFNKYRSIYLNNEASKAQDRLTGVPLDISKYKTGRGDSQQTGSNTDPSEKHTSDSSGRPVFPTIRFKELGADDNPYLPHGSDVSPPQPTNRRRSRKRSKSPRYKSLRQWKHEINKPISQSCVLKSASVTCSCNHKHTRSCRRRRGVGGAACNMCLMTSMRRLSRRISAKGSPSAKVSRKTPMEKQRLLQSKVAMLKFPKSILKSPKAVGEKAIGRNGSRRASSRRRVRFGKILFAKPARKQFAKRGKRSRNCVPKRRQQRKIKPKRNSSNSKRAAYQKHRRSASSKKTQVKKRRKNLDYKKRPKANVKRSNCVSKLQLPFKGRNRKENNRSLEFEKRTSRASKKIGKESCSVKPRGRPANSTYKVLKEGERKSKLSNKKKNRVTMFKNLIHKSNRGRLVASKGGGNKSRRKHKKSFSKIVSKGSKSKGPEICKSNNSIYHNEATYKLSNEYLQGSKSRVPKGSLCKNGGDIMATNTKRYKDKSNSNKLSRFGRLGKHPMKNACKLLNRRNSSLKEFRKLSLYRQEKSPRSKSNTTAVKPLRYSITPEGYNSLIKMFRSRYELLRAKWRHSSKKSRQGQQLSCGSTDRLVDQFRKVVSRYPTNRLGGLKNILSPLNSSTETVCHVPQQRTPARPFSGPRSKTGVLLSIDGGVWAEDQVHRENTPSPPSVHTDTAAPFSCCQPQQTGARNLVHTAFHADDSPPKLQAPPSLDDDLPSVARPGAYFYLSGQQRGFDNVVGAETSTGSSGCRENHDYCLRQVDSLELIRRRRLKQSKDVSRNACCCDRNAIKPENYIPSAGVHLPDISDYSPALDYLVCYCPEIDMCRRRCTPEVADLTDDSLSAPSGLSKPHSAFQPAVFNYTPKLMNENGFLVRDLGSNSSNYCGGYHPFQEVHRPFCDGHGGHFLGATSCNQDSSRRELNKEEEEFDESVHVLRSSPHLSHIITMTSPNTEPHSLKSRDKCDRIFDANTEGNEVRGTSEAVKEQRTSLKEQSRLSADHSEEGIAHTTRIANWTLPDVEMCSGSKVTEPPKMSCSGNMQPNKCDQKCSDLSKYKNDSTNMNGDRQCDLFRKIEICPTTCPHPTLVLRHLPSSSTGIAQRQEDSSAENHTSLLASLLSKETRTSSNENDSDFAIMDLEHGEKETVESFTETEEVMQTQSEDEPSLSLKKIGADEISDTAGRMTTEPFQKDGVAQQPYLDVKCPGICTTWITVASEGRLKYSFPDAINSIANGQAHNTVNVQYPGFFNGELDTNVRQQKKESRVCFEVDLRKLSAVEMSTAQQNEIPLPRAASGGLVETITQKALMRNNLEGQTDTTCVDDMQSRDCLKGERDFVPISFLLTENDNLIADGRQQPLRSDFLSKNNENDAISVPTFERDELIFSPETSESPSPPGETLGFSQVTGTLNQPSAFSAYRQGQLCACPSDDATLSDESSKENNNNAVETQVASSYAKDSRISDQRELISFSSKGCLSSHLPGADITKCSNLFLPNTSCSTPSDISIPENYNGFSTLAQQSISQPSVSLKSSPTTVSTETNPTISATDFTSSLHSGQTTTEVPNRKTLQSLHAISKSALKLRQQSNQATPVSDSQEGSSCTKTTSSACFLFDQATSKPQVSAISKAYVYGQFLLERSPALNNTPRESPSFAGASRSPQVSFPQQPDVPCLYKNGHPSASSGFQFTHLKGLFVTPEPTSCSTGSLNCGHNWVVLGKRKRRSLCPLSDTMAPPKKIPRMDPGVKVRSKIWSLCENDFTYAYSHIKFCLNVTYS